jgi:hypothetical protein
MWTMSAALHSQSWVSVSGGYARLYATRDSLVAPLFRALIQFAAQQASHAWSVPLWMRLSLGRAWDPRSKTLPAVCDEHWVMPAAL